MKKLTTLIAACTGIALSLPAWSQDLIGVTGGNNNFANPSSVVTVDSTSGTTNLLNSLAEAYEGRGLAGVAVNSAGRVYAVTGSPASGTTEGGDAYLLELDPDTGEVIDEVGVLLNSDDQTCTIGDLTFQPGTDILFAILSNGRNEQCGDTRGVYDGGELATIDTGTALVTVIGADPSVNNDNGGLAFAPDGTLYFVSGWNARGMFTVDPATGNYLTSIPTASRAMGLAVDSQGTIYGSGPFQTNAAGQRLEIIDPVTGDVAVVGPTSESFVHDIDFIGPTVPTAYFKVTKTFSDDSTDEVDVTLTCNTGLPLKQDFTIAGGDPEGVTFVVTDIPEGGADCEVTESGVPGGYTAVLNGGAGCEWEDVTGGLKVCSIYNEANPATYTVLKDWTVYREGGDVVDGEAFVTIECNAAIVGGDEDDGTWTLSDTLSDGETLVATVDTTDGPATCSATEEIKDSGVEQSASDCGEVPLPAGGSHTCTFTNTVFFEGIPTLSQYGLAVLVLLTLGVGFVGLRRFV